VFEFGVVRCLNSLTRFVQPTVSEDVRNINKVAPATKSASGAAGAVRKDKAWVLKGKPVEVPFFFHLYLPSTHETDSLDSLNTNDFFVWQVKWDGDWWQAKIKMVKYAPNSDKPDKVCYPLSISCLGFAG
jgi:hypothetical protein